MTFLSAQGDAAASSRDLLDRTHIANLKVLPHEQVEGSAGVGADDADAAAAAPQQPETEVGALLRLLLKQQLGKLPEQEKATQSGVHSWLVLVRPHSPLTPEPSVWRSSAAGRGRSGCRPCCGAGPSEPHPGCSPWTLSLTPSADRKFLVTDHNCKNQQCVFLFGVHSSSLTCTIISKVSRMIRLASVARFPSMSASCSSSALVLQ